MREIKLRYTFQHDETGRIGSVIKNLDDEGPYLDFPSNKWALLGRDQDTGFKDSDNNEVYDSDILEFILEIPLSRQQTRRGVVEWNDTMGAWMVDFPAYGETYQLYDLMDKFGPSEFKKIGNCHENPELLEEILDD